MLRKLIKWGKIGPSYHLSEHCDLSFYSVSNCIFRACSFVSNFPILKRGMNQTDPKEQIGLFLISTRGCGSHSRKLLKSPICSRVQLIPYCFSNRPISYTSLLTNVWAFVWYNRCSIDGRRVATCRIERSGFEPWPGAALRCVLGQVILLSQCLSPPRCINGYRQT